MSVKWTLSHLICLRSSSRIGAASSVHFGPRSSLALLVSAANCLTCCNRSVRKSHIRQSQLKSQVEMYIYDFTAVHLRIMPCTKPASTVVVDFHIETTACYYTKETICWLCCHTFWKGIGWLHLSHTGYCSPRVYGWMKHETVDQDVTRNVMFEALRLQWYVMTVVEREFSCDHKIQACIQFFLGPLVTLQHKVCDVFLSCDYLYIFIVIGVCCVFGQ